MANRVVLAFDATYAFPETIAAGDNIDMQTTGKVVNLAAATTAGDALSYGQSGATLAGLALTAALAMGGNQINALGTPALATDAATKGYVDSLATAARSWREVLLVRQQLLAGGSGGVLPSELANIATNPSDGDTFVITDGTNTETYTFKTSPTGSFQVQIGGSAAATQTNLVAKITASSAHWAAVSTTGLGEYFSGTPTTQFVVYRTATEATVTDRIYGTLSGGQAGIQVVDFHTAGFTDYGTEAATQANLPSSDPGAQRFGFSRQFAGLYTCETHLVANDVSTWTWNDAPATLAWYESDQSALVFNLGLTRTGNTINVNTANASGTYIDGSNNVAVKITATNPGISILSDGLQSLLDPNGGLAHGAAGDKVFVDTVTSGNPTLAEGSNGLRVIGVPLNFNINSVATSNNVTAANLGTLTAGTDSDASALHTHYGMKVDAVTVNALNAGDPVYWSSTNDQVDKAVANVDAKAWVIGVNDNHSVAGAGTAKVVTSGICTGILSSATAGSPYYLGVSGGLSTTPPGSGGNRVIQVGLAKNATDLWVRVIDYGKKV